MLLCNIQDVNPGTTLGAAVVNPAAPWVELLKPGVLLDASLLARLRERGVTQLWVQHDLTADLDAAVAAQALAVKTQVYTQLKQDFAKMSQRTIGAVDVQRYRQVVMELVVHLVASAQFAGLTDQLFACEPTLFSHASNVAYISTLVGIQLQDYIVRERKRLAANHARDLTSLGLGAMLHDMGKAHAGDGAPLHHEVSGDEAHASVEEPEGYRQHTVAGYKVLRDCRTPASATQIVLNHHQRFDGRGWPAMSELTGKAHRSAQVGREIHVLTRIAAAANVLDNLLTGAENKRRPPVAALCEFAGHRFDGWFDPTVRRAVLRCIPPFAVGSLVKLSDGRDAIVTAPNVREPCRPMVRAIDGSPVSGPANGSASGDQWLPESLRIVQCIGVDVESWLFTMPAGTEPLRAAG